MAQSIRWPILIGLFWLGASLFAGEPLPSHPMPLADFEIRYEKTAADLRSRIKLGQISLNTATIGRLAKSPKVNSPQGLRSLRIAPADTMRPGPWTTQVYFMDESDQAHALRLVVSDHGNGGIRCNWINEKLVFIQAWWGRIRTTEMILDVQTRSFLYLEDADYFGLSLPLDQRASRK